MRNRWPIITEEDQARVLSCLNEGRLWRGNGKYLLELEEKFADLHQTSYALAVTNGTHALEIALDVAGVGYGDEVLIPAYTFIATASAVLMRNALPIPVEVDPLTYCMNPTRIAEQITDRTRAIMPVHIAGHSCDMDPIMDLADEHNLVVVEDCAHAHGSSYKGRSLGSIGHAGTFSFQAIKTMTAGEGGMLITDDHGLWTRAYNFFNCGRRPEGPSYVHVSLSSNYRMSEVQAALLVGQVDRVEEQIRERTKKVRFLNEQLSRIPGIVPQGRADYVTTQGYSMYMFRYEQEAFKGLTREEFIVELNRLGFPAFRTYPVFYTAAFFQTLYERYKQFDQLPHKVDYSQYDFPVSTEISDKVVWLPHFFLFSEYKELRRLQQVVRKIQAEKVHC